MQKASDWCYYHQLWVSARHPHQNWNAINRHWGEPMCQTTDRLNRQGGKGKQRKDCYSCVVPGLLKSYKIYSNHWNVRQKQVANPDLLHSLLPQLTRFFHPLLCFPLVFWFYVFLISGTTPGPIIPVMEHAWIKSMVDESLAWFFLGWMHQVEMVLFPDQLLLLSTLYNTPLLQSSWQNIAASAKSFEGEKVCSKNVVCMIT